jgi:hypothetical protein
MTSNKTFAFAILLGNIIGMFLYYGILGASTSLPEFQTKTEQIINVNSTRITQINPNYDRPQTGISFIDMLVAIYFTVSTVWAIWVIINPFSG